MAGRGITVRQLAHLSGVSVRTLHHYDDIGLLRPASVGANRYRYYGHEELERLQQILLYRELEVPLTEIAKLLSSPEFDRRAALREQRARLAARQARYGSLIETIDRTLAALEGDLIMNEADLYRGFPPEKQRQYEEWLVEHGGVAMRERIAASKTHLGAQPPAKLAALMQEVQEIEAALAARCREHVAADSVELAPLLERHRSWVARMWGRPCSHEAHAGLADLYLAHPDFRVRYETFEPGLAVWLAGAMKANAQRGHADETLL